MNITAINMNKLPNGVARFSDNRKATELAIFSLMDFSFYFHFRNYFIFDRQ
jgi:hypothetical protein